MAIIINNATDSQVSVSDDGNGNTVIDIKSKDNRDPFSRVATYEREPTDFDYMIVGRLYFNIVDNVINKLSDDVKTPNSKVSKSLKSAFDIKHRR